MMSVASLQVVMASVSFIVLLCCKKHLTIEPAGNNPFDTVYRVLKYSWKHKVPEQRSAFTYWEEDIPRRIDLGKHSCTSTRQLARRLCPSAWALLLTTASPPLLETITALVFIGLFDFLLLPYFRRYVPNLFKRLGIGLSHILLQELVAIVIVWRANEEFVEPFCNQTKYEKDHFARCLIGRFYFNNNGVCAASHQVKHSQCDGEAVSSLFLWILIPQLIRSVAYLLVFTSALEFICAQAPLRMKGLLIGIWYATFALQNLATHAPDEMIELYHNWMIFHGVRAFFYPRLLDRVLLCC